MKKLLCMALCLIMVVSLCACGGDANTPADTDGAQTGASTQTNENGSATGATTEETQNSVPGATTEGTQNDEPKFVNDDGTIVLPEFVGGKSELESSTIFENEIVKVYVYAFNAFEANSNTAGGMNIALKIENKSGKRLYFELQSVCINGLDMGGYSHIEIAAGETNEKNIHYPLKELAESGISKIYNGTIYFWTKAEGDTEKNYYESITFKTTEKGEQVNYTEGKTIYEKDGIKVVLQNTGWVNEYEKEVGHIRFYVENSSDKKCRIEITQMDLIGYISVNMPLIGSTDFSVMAQESGYYTHWIGDYPDNIETALPIEKVSMCLEITTADTDSRAWSGQPDDTFTVEITDWDWSAIKG